MKRFFVRLCAFAAFMLVAGGAFWRAWHVLGYYDNIHSKAVFRQFYSLPRNTVDAVWLGASSTQEFIIPSEMYDEAGIALYSLSVGNEPFMFTRHLIAEAEKRHDPQLYLVDIRQLAYYTWDDTYVRRVTDNMQVSKNRVDAIRYMLGNLAHYRDTFVADPMLDYMIPFTTYHTRWAELKPEDYGKDDNAFFGYFIKTSARPFDRDTVQSRFSAEPAPPPEESLAYLSDLLDFCDTFEKPVVFTRTPNCLEPELFAQYNFIQRVIEQRGYRVWDMNLEADAMGIDYATDFADPMHTNVYGARKVSRYAARQLRSQYNLPDRRGNARYAAYGAMSQAFGNKLSQAELKATTGFAAYLDKVLALDKNDYTVFIAIKDIQGWHLTADMTDTLVAMGFDRAGILLEHRYHSFVGVIANGRVVCQRIGTDDEPQHYEGNINGQHVSMDSKMWINNGGNLASIRLGAVEYAKNARGFNIVVVDNRGGTVVDSVAFDTHVPELRCTR